MAEENKHVESDEGAAQTFEVEDLLEHRVGDDGEDFFLVKWNGYTETSWEPDSNIGAELNGLKEAVKRRCAGGDAKQPKESKDKSGKKTKKEKKGKKKKRKSSSRDVSSSVASDAGDAKEKKKEKEKEGRPPGRHRHGTNDATICHGAAALSGAGVAAAAGRNVPATHAALELLAGTCALSARAGSAPTA